MKNRYGPSPFTPKQIGDREGSGVTNIEPHDFGREAVDEAKLTKVGVLGYDHEAVTFGILPDLSIRPRPQADVADVSAAWVLSAKPCHECGAEVRVEENLHATEFVSRRSRAAAKARVARMSSRDRSGKSPRI